jgi:hypothetical protein
MKSQVIPFLKFKIHKEKCINLATFGKNYVIFYYYYHRQFGTTLLYACLLVIIANTKH